MTDFPPPHPTPWARRAPFAAGPDAGAAAAAGYAAEHETPWQRDLALMVTSDFDERPPWNETLGPVRPRGGPNGLVLRGGGLVAEWGDTAQIDMTFSVAKSYLSILAGLAWDRGLIGDPHDEVRRTVDDRGFDPPHNGAITWHHLLQQTSEWEGVLWDKPDLIDRHRAVGGRPSAAPKGSHRDLESPGGFWEYNDVRVNRLSLALLRLWRRPLPEVFRELVMDPIGASPDWEWHGYRNSWVEIGGRRMQSVSGGAHWGGGVFIHARDQARIGLMLLRRGMWGGRRILSEAWIERMLEPCPLNRQYGYLWWLNTGRGLYPNASERSFYARGAGGNLTWIDPENDIVAVLRWTDRSNGRVYEADDGDARDLIALIHQKEKVMLTLYLSPGSSSMAPHIALHEIGAPFESRWISFAKKEQHSPEYLAVNPEAKVPTLLVDGRPLTEVAAVLYYLAKRYPEAGLWPEAGLEAEAQAISWMSFIASTVHPARRIGVERWKEVFEIAERRLGKPDWVVGGYSIVDIHLFRLYWRFVTTLKPAPGSFPNLSAHFDRMMARPAVQRTLEIEASIGYQLPQ